MDLRHRSAAKAHWPSLRTVRRPPRSRQNEIVWNGGVNVSWLSYAMRNNLRDKAHFILLLHHRDLDL
jgi:hypothetical protein